MHRTLKMYVNIFKTAIDVRIKYVYINVRLTVDKRFYFVTQEILQVEDVIFTWRYGNIWAKQGDYLSNFATIYLVSGEET